jgi:type VI secretion system protein ImpF
MTVVRPKISNFQGLQPSLLDRFVGDAVALASYGVSHYREAVLRDLEFLLNSKSRMEAEGLREFPEAASSVLNYGMPDPAGRYDDPLSIRTITRNIAEALRCFEPRIDSATVHVHPIPRPPGEAQSNPHVLAFEITGELWATPTREMLRIRTEIDLETGKCRF